MYESDYQREDQGHSSLCFSFTSPSNAFLAVLWREIHAMAFHQQIPLLIDLYVFFRIPPLSHISFESLHSTLMGGKTLIPTNRQGKVDLTRTSGYTVLNRCFSEPFL